VDDFKYQLEYPIGKVIYRTNGFLSGLRLSPDGELLAFVEHPIRDTPGGMVCVVDRSGHRRLLTGNLRRVRGLAWTPQGKELAFGGDYLGLVNLSGEQRDLARWSGSPVAWDISRDGRLLTRDVGTRCEIAAASEADARPGRLSWFDWSVAADLSIDGRTLLFYESGEGVGLNFTTFFRRMDGSEPARLGDGKALALSQDQKWALVSLTEPDRHLRLLPTGVGQPRDLPGGGIHIYHWAFFFPDGRRIGIAGEEKDRLPRTYVQNVDGGPPRPFGEEGLRISVVSPDGKRLAGTTSDGRAFIFQSDGNGTDPRPIPGVDPGEFLVQWGSDGNSLYVRGIETNPLTLYRVDLQSGKRALWKRLRPTEEAGFIEFGAGPRGVRITPDARSVVYTYWTEQANLYVIEGLQSRWR